MASLSKKKNKKRKNRTTSFEINNRLVTFLKEVKRDYPYKLMQIAEETGIHPKVVKNWFEIAEFIKSDFPQMRIYKKENKKLKKRIDFIIFENEKEPLEQISENVRRINELYTQIVGGRK